MPELPEVETTRRGIAPHIRQQTVTKIQVRQAQLRWPVPATLKQELPGQVIQDVLRRGKYLLLQVQRGCVVIHLGMSGSLRIVNNSVKAGKHDHVDIEFGAEKCLRFTDPRRFGCVLWHTDKIESHPLLASLGPEPFSAKFTGDYLYKLSRGRRAPIKSFIMDAQVVVGVGNIYANEALFLSGIDPRRAAGRIGSGRYSKLAESIKEVLTQAIEVGGTTLRDFTNSEGEPGYFKQSLRVYGRGGQDCRQCAEPLKEVRMAQRSTVYCKNCQR